MVRLVRLGTPLSSERVEKYGNFRLMTRIWFVDNGPI